MNIQKQVRENAQYLQDYLKDLHQWLDVVKTKDEKLKKSMHTKKNLPPIRKGGVFDFKVSTVAVVDTKKSSNNKETETHKSQNTTKTIEKGAGNDMPELEEVPEVAARIKSQTPNTNVASNENKKKIEEVVVDHRKELEESKKKSGEEKEKGNDFFKKGKYREAIDCYSRSIELDPLNALSYANRAMSYLKLNEYEKAEEDCSDAIGIDKKYLKAYARRGTARIQLKRYHEAIDDFQEVLTLEPGNKEAIAELGRIDKILNPTGVAVTTSSNVTQPARKKVVIEEVDSRETKPKEEKRPEPVPVTVTESKTPSLTSTTTVETTGATSPRVGDVTKTTTSTTAASESKATGPSPKNATTPVRKSFLVKVNVPTEPPKTSYEFESVWNSVKSDLASFYKYMKVIPPPSLGQNF